MIKEIKKVLGLKRLKEIEEENKKTARLGLYPLWELSQDHPFHEASKAHDLAYLVAYDLIKMNETDLAINHVIEADKKFKKMVYKIASQRSSIWLKFQARLFSSIVIAYRKLRFGQ